MSMKRYQLTVKLRFTAMDDVEARILGQHWLSVHFLSDAYERKLQEIRDDRAPRKVEL